MDQLAAIFGSAGFLPHGYCLLWRPDILALHAVSDVVIAASYFSIPLAIMTFVRRRLDLIAEHKRIAVLFSVFILGCGMTHVFGVIILWQPVYILDGLVKAFTAIVSIVTAILLWPVLPRLLEIPSPGQLALANAALHDEIVAKDRAVAELQAMKATLEQQVQRRTAEVQALARRFEIATAGSVVTVSEQDEDLRYTWLHNPRPPLSAASLGRTDDEVFGAASDKLTPLKRRVLTTGKPLRTDIDVPIDGADYYFDMKITPARVGSGAGVLVAAVDVTQQKRQHEHLQIIMRELAHRARNLLSLVDGIARQTAKSEGLSQAFVARFGDRLSALGGAYDLLISADWKGVDLRPLIEGQLAPVMPSDKASDKGRVSIRGPAIVVSPEAGQYLALAIHELATNATKHGALKRSDGVVEVVWRRRASAGGRHTIELTWTERGAALAPPQRSGFGRLLLETLVARALKGSSSLEFDDAGLRWRGSFPG